MDENIKEIVILIRCHSLIQQLGQQDIHSSSLKISEKYHLDHIHHVRLEINDGNHYN